MTANPEHRRRLETLVPCGFPTDSLPFDSLAPAPFHPDYGGVRITPFREAA